MKLYAVYKFDEHLANIEAKTARQAAYLYCKQSIWGRSNYYRATLAIKGKHF